MEICERVAPGILETAAPKTEAVDLCILAFDVTSSTALRYTAQVEKFERWLQVRDVHGLPELLETGLASFIGETVEYQRGAFASASLSLLWRSRAFAGSPACSGTWSRV